MTIHRYTKDITEGRTCEECLKEKRKGFWFYWERWEAGANFWVMRKDGLYVKLDGSANASLASDHPRATNQWVCRVDTGALFPVEDVLDLTKPLDEQITIVNESRNPS